jgi:hypothetical protein
MRPCKVAFATLALTVAGLLLPAAALSEENSPEDGSFVADLIRQTELGGSLRAAYWSSSRSLNNQDNLPVAALWLHGSSQLAPGVSLFAEGWVRNDDLFKAEATSGLFRQGYLDLRFGPLDLRLGKQIIAWGRADRINPTDNLTPKDFTLLVPEDSDQRSGTTGIKATYHWASFSLIGVWLPTFEPDTIPIQQPPPTFTLRERVPGEPVSQWAVKIEQAGREVDWSVSYFEGFDLHPDLEIMDIGLSGVNLALTHHRIQVIGADAATAVGPYTLRGEAAYTFTKHSQNSQVKSPFFALVLGGDRTVLQNLNINLQYILRVISEFQAPREIPDPLLRGVAIQRAMINNQLDRVQQSVALRISKKWLNDTLNAELGSIVSLTRSDFAVRPKITYAITDHVKATVGADIFRGGIPSFFGRLRDTSTAYAELRWDF